MTKQFCKTLTEAATLRFERELLYEDEAGYSKPIQTSKMEFF